MRPSWSHKLKRDSSEKTTWCQSACQALCSWAHCRRSHWWFALRGILHKRTLAHSPWCSRHRWIGKANISTLEAVDQHAINCLEEALQSFITMWRMCHSLRTDITFCHPLLVFQVVQCLSVHCFQMCITAELLRCYCNIKKSSFSKADNSPPNSNSISCWNFFFFHRRDILRSYSMFATNK